MDTLNPESVGALFPLLYTQRRIDDWQALFHPQAPAIRVEQRATPEIAFFSLGAMLAGQQDYQRENRHIHERWDNVEVHRFGNIAVVRADYVLEADHEVRRGCDVLTMARAGDTWRIVSLVYEQTSLAGR